MGNRQSAHPSPGPDKCRHVTRHSVCAPANSLKSDWGPLYWRHLDLRAIAWPDNPDVRTTIAEHEYLRTFLGNLPCADCGTHAVNYYDHHMPNLGLGSSYQVWLIDFHNDVNRRLGKPMFTIEEYRERHQRELLGRA
jgi:hypothetical protein